MIDLHCHSTASDGTLTPTELIERAKKNNLEALALTDHDTTDGLNELYKAAEGSSIEAIPGIELSTTWYSSSLHIVGLFIDPDNKFLQEFLKTVIDNRDTRNDKIIKKLQSLGYKITLEDCLAEAGGEVLGRPHIATAMMKKGYFNDLKSVFNELIGTGRPAYVKRYLPMPAAGIHVIHQAGGLAVWAHPYAMRSVPFHTVKKVGSLLKSNGLDGVECYYSHFTDIDFENANRLQRQLNLLQSGGSDFHGANSPGVDLGTGIDNNLNIPYSIIEEMKKKRGMIV